jgi:hypothetical protein
MNNLVISSTVVYPYYIEKVDDVVSRRRYKRDRVKECKRLRRELVEEAVKSGNSFAVLGLLNKFKL